MLFDRSLVDPAKTELQRQDEGIYSYLSTNNRPVCEAIRAKLDEWFASYPEEHRWELAQRIKTSGNEFDSEIFELILHEVFRRLGFGVDIHPDLPDDVEKKPDFLISDDDGNSLFVECVLATGQSEAEVASQNLVHSIYQKINEKLRSPRYFWSVQVLSKDQQAPRAGAIIYAVAEWMKGLDEKDVIEQFEQLGFSTPHQFIWESGGWRIQFLPIPKDPAKVNIPHRPIGVIQGNAGRIVDDEPILAAANFKAKRYGDGARPLAIAINATSLTVDELDFSDALFPRGVARPGGLWMREDGTLRNQNVEAIIAVRKCHSWNFGSPIIRVFNNPFVAVDPIIAKLPFSRTVCTPEGGTNHGGISLAQVLELPPNWPE